jgi:hypothetical protein
MDNVNLALNIHPHVNQKLPVKTKIDLSKHVVLQMEAVAWQLES